MLGGWPISAGVSAPMASILASILLPALLGQAPAFNPGGSDAGVLRDRLRAIQLADAAGYAIDRSPINDLTDRYRLFVDRTIPPVEEMDSTGTPKTPGRNP